MYCCGGCILSISCTDWPKKWKASHWTRHCVEPSYKRSLCLLSSDRERESVWGFLSRSCIGLLTWCMSSVKRGFVALRQLLAFNTHPHNSICVCDFPFGKLWAFNLSSQASVYIEGAGSHHKPNDTVDYCDYAVIAKFHAHVPKHTGKS